VVKFTSILFSTRLRLQLFFVVISYTISAQTFASHKVALTQEFKSTNLFNEEAARANLKTRYSSDFKTSEELTNFIDYLLASKKQIFESNYIYTNLPEVSLYVRNILNRVIPKRLLDTSLKVYIVRDPDFNASVLGDGSVFVNIGFLAGIDNEAELAAVLGHEFGHYEARIQSQFKLFDFYWQ
jgi:predicted Zn-dependent protease